MTIIVNVLAVIGALCLTGWALILASNVWCVVHNRRRNAAMQRHPAGSRPDGRPWWAHVGCCGQRVYGDSLTDLLVNQEFHERSCPMVDRRRAA